MRYWLIVDPFARRVERRTKGHRSLVDELTTGCWCEVSKEVWKQYRAGDIVAPGDLNGKALDELRRRTPRPFQALEEAN